MKNLKDLSGVKILNKNEQKAIKGGVFACGDGAQCPSGWCCPKDYRLSGNVACTRCVEF